jgi:hypothetical protein
MNAFKVAVRGVTLLVGDPQATDVLPIVMADALAVDENTIRTSDLPIPTNTSMTCARTMSACDVLYFQ